VGEGFTDISTIMNIYRKIAQNENLEFTLIEKPIENCAFDEEFDFILSINVMEHLRDPYAPMTQITQNLKPLGKFRFFCPNYDFPYEPHFGKWLTSRSRKAFFLPRSRASSHLIPEKEALGLYLSINFLTLRKVKRSLTGTNLSILANRNSLYELMNRSIIDSELEKRHRGLTLCTKLLFRLKLHYLAKLVPVNYQPIMDVEITLLSD